MLSKRSLLSLALGLGLFVVALAALLRLVSPFPCAPEQGFARFATTPDAGELAVTWLDQYLQPWLEALLGALGLAAAFRFAWQPRPRRAALALRALWVLGAVVTIDIAAKTAYSYRAWSAYAETNVAFQPGFPVELRMCPTRSGYGPVVYGLWRPSPTAQRTAAATAALSPTTEPTRTPPPKLTGVCRGEKSPVRVCDETAERAVEKRIGPVVLCLASGARRLVFGAFRRVDPPREGEFRTRITPDGTIRLRDAAPSPRKAPEPRWAYSLVEEGASLSDAEEDEEDLDRFRSGAVRRQSIAEKSDDPEFRLGYPVGGFFLVATAPADDGSLWTIESNRKETAVKRYVDGARLAPGFRRAPVPFSHALVPLSDGGVLVLHEEGFEGAFATKLDRDGRPDARVDQAFRAVGESLSSPTEEAGGAIALDLPQVPVAGWARLSADELALDAPAETPEPMVPGEPLSPRCLTGPLTLQGLALCDGGAVVRVGCGKETFTLRFDGQLRVR